VVGGAAPAGGDDQIVGACQLAEAPLDVGERVAHHQRAAHREAQRLELLGQVRRVPVGDDTAQELAARQQDRGGGPGHALAMPCLVIVKVEMPCGSVCGCPATMMVTFPGAPSETATGPLAWITACSPCCSRY